MLMAFMMLEFPYTIYESVKLKDEWKYFDAEAFWHLYVFITCLVFKVLIECAFIYYFFRFF